jgi:DNA-binding MarR family transcriptional regulator
MEYDSLKLSNQLCFPLYAASKEVIKKYKPYLDKYDLTYTQYIVLMVLFEYKDINVKTLGNKLYLDSGTLTPLLKKLETKNLIVRNRNKNDERNLIVSLTSKGEKLKESLKDIPGSVGSCISLNKEEAEVLYKLLYKVLDFNK